MLDELPNRIIYLITSILGYICTSFLIYTVYMRSTAEMRHYKFALLKLSVCELVFSISLSAFLQPDLLLPLPAVAIRSPVASSNEQTAKLMGCFSLIAAMTVYTAINDCCFLRSILVFHMEGAIRFFFSIKGVIVVVLINVFYAVLAIPVLLYSLASSAEFLGMVRKEGSEEYLGAYKDLPNTVFVSLDRERSVALVSLLFVAFFGFHSTNLVSSALVYRRLQEFRSSLSKESIRTQKKLSYMLICQNLYPMLSISVPVLTLILAYIDIFGMASTGKFLAYYTTSCLSLYPIISCAITLHFIQPYKAFFFSLLRRVPWLWKLVPPEKRSTGCNWSSSTAVLAN